MVREIPSWEGRGRLSEIGKDELKAMLDANSRTSAREIAEEPNVAKAGTARLLKATGEGK